MTSLQTGTILRFRTPDSKPRPCLAFAVA
jgi:hypothetical protein